MANTRVSPVPQHAAVLAVVLLGFLLRLGWSLAVPNQPISDTAIYHARAVGIAEGRGYSTAEGKPTAYYPVGYPAVLGAAYRVCGASLTVGKLLNCALFIGIALFLWSIAGWLWNDATALAVLLLLALYPNHVAYSSLLSAEYLGQALMLGGVFMHLQDSRRLADLGAGLLYGGATLVKPQLVFVPLLVEGVVWLHGRRSATLRRALAIAGMMLLVIGPWAIRNYLVFQRVVIVSTNAGPNLFMGNNPRATGGPDTANAAREFAGLGENELDLAAARAARSFILSNPGAFLRLVPKKLYYLYKTDGDGFAWNVESFPNPSSATTRFFFGLKVFAQAYYLALIALAAFTIYRLALPRSAGNVQPEVHRNGRLALTLPLVLIAYFSVVYAVIVGSPRYHCIVMPWVIVLAGPGLVALGARIARAWVRRSGPTAVLPDICHA